MRWWSDFNATLVSWLKARYGAASVAGVEVWNEEDYYPIFWSLVPATPSAMARRYSQVLCGAFAGTRRVDQSLPVVLGGFNPADTTYLQDLYTSSTANVRNCMSAIGIHPYDDPDQAPTDPKSAFATGATNVSQLAAREGDAARSIWITEFGYPIADPPTADQQAAWDAQAYQLAPSLPNVRAMGIHTIFDRPGGFEICRGPGSPLPAATALKQAVSGAPLAVASC